MLTAAVGTKDPFSMEIHPSDSGLMQPQVSTITEHLLTQLTLLSECGRGFPYLPTHTLENTSALKSTAPGRSKGTLTSSTNRPRLRPIIKIRSATKNNFFYVVGYKNSRLFLLLPKL